MSSLVLELQRDSLDSSVAISDLLRKAFVVAHKLQVQEFEEWVTRELDGYQDVADVPQYRQIRGSVRAWNPFHGWQPVLCENPKDAEALSLRPCLVAVAELERLLSNRERNSGRGMFTMPFSPEGEHTLRAATGAESEITFEVPEAALVRIVETTRNIMLKWSLKLQADGILGDGLSFKNEERDSAKQASYNVNNFFAPVHNSQIHQNVADSVHVSYGNMPDRAILDKFLHLLESNMSSLGLAPQMSQELQAEMKTVKAQIESPRPRHPAIKEALSSIRRILEGAGGGMAAQLLPQLVKLLSG